jgi:hypothetical protein
MTSEATKCPNMGGCSLFPVLGKSGFLRVWQINYCETDFGKCERYRLSTQGKHVAPTLLPNGRNLSALPR